MAMFWALCLGALPAGAQGLLDTSFVPPNDWESWGSVQTHAQQPDGKVLVSGIFHWVDEYPTTLLRLNPDGSEDATFRRIASDLPPSRLLIQPDGRILVGGDWIEVFDDRPFRFLTRLNPDGTQDASFVPAAISADSLSGLALQRDGKLLIAGQITNVDGVAGTRCMARLNADGSRDASFVSPFPGSCPNQIAVLANGKILVAGSFQLVAGGVTQRLARLDPDGSLDANLTEVAGLNSSVAMLYPLPDGRVLVNGKTSGGLHKVVRLNADDTLDAGFEVILAGSFNNAHAMYAQPDGGVVVSGDFLQVNTLARPGGLARVHADGAPDPSLVLASGGIDGYVSSVSARPDGRIVAAGTFTRIENVARPKIAQLLVSAGASELLSFGDSHAHIRWQRSGAGMEIAQVRFESSTDGQSWTPLGFATWNAGAWELDGLALPEQTSLWLRASGTAALNVQGRVSGSVLGSTRQLVAKVTPFADAGGSIEPDTPQYVDAGTIASFTITPDYGQQILAVEGSCDGTLDGNVFTTNAITADCTVHARFAEADRYIVTPNAGPGGSISPSEPQSVVEGETLELTVTPHPGYAIVEVGGTCGGTLEGNTYTTLPIVANCTVEASFSLTMVTVTASVSGEHGSIEPATQTLEANQAATLTVTPQAGYNAIVEGCGGTLSGNIYTTAVLTEDCEVVASFAPFTEAGVSLQLKVAQGTGNDVCATGQSSIEVAFDTPIRWCAVLTNETDRPLRWSSVIRGAYANDWNGIYPGLLLGDITLAPGESIGVPSANPIFRPKESTDLRVTWSAQDAAGELPVYSHDDTAAFEPIDLSTSPGAQRLALDRPRASTGVTLPFRFNFYGIPTDVLCVGYDGVLAPTLEACDMAAGYSVYGTGGLGNLFSPALLIVPAIRNSADFVYGYDDGDVYYQVQGAAPNRRAIFEWNDMHIYGVDGQGVTFQVLIEEATSAITFQYVSMVVGVSGYDNGAYADAGLQRTRDYVQRYGSIPGADLTDGKAIRWTPGAQPFTALATASAHLTVLAPEITVEPAGTGIQAQARTGDAAIETLALGNLGNASLAWQLETASAAGRGFVIEKAHVPSLVQAAPKAATAARTVPGSAAQQAAAQGSASVPAYAHAYDYGDGESHLVSLDATAPAPLAHVSWNVHVQPVHAGGFVDNDFSRLYLFQSPGTSDDGVWNGELFRIGVAAENDRSSVLYGVGTVPLAGQSWRGMRWDFATNTLFAVASDFSIWAAPPFRTDLYRVDPITGLVKHIARLDDASSAGTALADIAIDNHGRMYGIDMGTDTLVAIDKTNGHIQPIGSTGLNVSWWGEQSIDFDHATGVLYYATWTLDSTVGNQMFTVDPETGEARLIGTIGDGLSSLRALSIATPGGACVGADEAPWLSFDKDSGSIDPLDLETVGVTLDASDLSEGTYKANLCIGNNTPYQGQITVPVTFTVLGEPIFADGFETD